MNSLAFPKLKHSVCVVNNLQEKPKVLRYVVETQKDLTAFLKVFTKLKQITSAVNNLKDAIRNSQVLLLTDMHPLSGFNTYCYEQKDCIVRVK